MKKFYSLMLVSSLAVMALHAESDAGCCKSDPVQSCACDCEDDDALFKTSASDHQEFSTSCAVSKNDAEQQSETGFHVTYPLWLKKAGVAVAMQYLALKKYMQSSWNWVSSHFPVEATDSE